MVIILWASAKDDIIIMLNLFTENGSNECENKSSN